MVHYSAEDILEIWEFVQIVFEKILETYFHILEYFTKMVMSIFDNGI